MWKCNILLFLRLTRERLKLPCLGFFFPFFFPPPGEESGAFVPWSQRLHKTLERIFWWGCLSLHNGCQSRAFISLVELGSCAHLQPITREWATDWSHPISEARGGVYTAQTRWTRKPGGVVLTKGKLEANARRHNRCQKARTTSSPLSRHLHCHNVVWTRQTLSQSRSWHLREGDEKKKHTDVFKIPNCSKFCESHRQWAEIEDTLTRMVREEVREKGKKTQADRHGAKKSGWIPYLTPQPGRTPSRSQA